MSFTHKMVAPLLALCLALSLAVVSFSGKASETSASPDEATLVVYRAGEFAPTEQLRVDVRLDNQRLGRLTREDAVATWQPAGSYVISTGIPGAESLEVDLKPGQVHYVRIGLRQRTQQLRVALVEVEEQVAHVERPELASAI